MTAGGMVDNVARTIAQDLTERLGKPVITENRPGANGVIALEALMTSPPDGHTLILATQAMLVFNPFLMKTKVPYDSLRDFASVSTLFAAPLYLVVHPSVPARSIPELIALAKSQPGKLSYASIGVGSGQHLAAELFKARTGVDLLHVPYKGTGPAMADLLAGRVQMMFQAASTLPHIRSGKLRALASLGPQRTQAMPELPTVSEAGVPGFEMLTWFGLSTRAGVPRPIIDQLNREVGILLRSPAAREKFAASNIELIPSTPEEMDERVRREIPLFAKLMRDAGLKRE